VTAALEANRLSKRYGRRPALTDCTLRVPEGGVVGLVGPNGAGKTTLLHLAVGLLEPTSGAIDVLGAPAGGYPQQLARIGFVAQDTPLYAKLSVADHLELGARLNPGWDSGLAEGRIEQLQLDPRQRAGELSGGQRAQLALALAIAKKPRLLILDEPVASLDPLARREFLQSLMEITAEQRVTVVISSHVIADLERVCDYLVLLAGSRVQLSGDVEELLANHRRLTGPRRDPARLPEGQVVVEARHTDRQSTLLIRSEQPVADPAWTVEEVGLEDLVLAYMGSATRDEDRAGHFAELSR
jgi:ABC-2 type transport system ATP-binding protein